MGENPGATRTPRVARSLDRRAGKRASDREPSPTPPRRRSTTATPSPRARAFQTGRGKTGDVEVPVAFHRSTCDIYSRSLRPSDVRGRQVFAKRLDERHGRRTRQKTRQDLFSRAPATLVSPRARAGRARGRGRAFAPRSPDPDRPSRHTRLFLFSARNAASAVPAPMAASAPASLGMVFGCSPNVLR